MKKFWENRYFRFGLTLFLTGVAILIFAQITLNFGNFRIGLKKLMRIISPFIYGFVMAYLLTPIYNYVVRKIYHGSKGKFKSSASAFKFAKVIASILSVLIILGFVFGLIILIVPQVVESATTISQNMPARLEQLNGTINSFLAGLNNHELAEQLTILTDNAQQYLIDWVRETLIPGVGNYMQALTSRVIVTLRTVMNLVIGIIVCVYFLNGKEQFKAQFRKVVRSFNSQKLSDEVFLFANYTNKTFGNFINGKIIDSFIIGILCFILMSIFRMPYPILISIIIGITNIIPFFGPFIGAIPSAFIILLVSPLKALYFLILIIVLQQFDGNILGPRILGSTTGLSSFWVMFAIIVGGGLFGFAGMLLGVPIFAVLYFYIGRAIRRRLKNRGLPENTDDYIDFNSYDINRKDVL